jgi:hypothetical protein
MARGWTVFVSKKQVTLCECNRLDCPDLQRIVFCFTVANRMVIVLHRAAGVAVCAFASAVQCVLPVPKFISTAPVIMSCFW